MGITGTLIQVVGIYILQITSLVKRIGIATIQVGSFIYQTQHSTMSLAWVPLDFLIFEEYIDSVENRTLSFLPNITSS
jgi:hypothetical protein